MDEKHPLTDPISELITNYHELNGSAVAIVPGSISALEFMRYVARNRPFVLRGGASEWEATRTWNISSLKELLKGQSVNVAVTAEGYVLTLSDAKLKMQAEQIEMRILQRGMMMESYFLLSLGKNSKVLKNS